MKLPFSFSKLVLVGGLLKFARSDPISENEQEQSPVPAGFAATFFEIPSVPGRSVEANQFWDLSGQRILHSSNGIREPSFDLSYMRGAKWMAYEISGYFKALENGEHTFRFRNNNGSSLQIGAGAMCHKDAFSSVWEKLDIDPTTKDSARSVTVNLEKNRIYPFKIVDCHQGPHFDASVLLTTPKSMVPRDISEEIIQYKPGPDFEPVRSIKIPGSRKRTCDLEHLVEDGTGLRFRAFQLKFNNKPKRPEGYISYYSKTPVRAEGSYNRLDWVPKVYDMELKEQAFALELMGYFTPPEAGIFTISLKAHGSASLQIGPGILLPRTVEMKQIDTAWVKIDTRVPNRKRREIKKEFQIGLKYPIRAVLINDNSRPKLDLVFVSPSGIPIDFTVVSPFHVTSSPETIDEEPSTSQMSIVNPISTTEAIIQPENLVERVKPSTGNTTEPLEIPFEFPITNVAESTTGRYEREASIVTDKASLSQNNPIDENLVQSKSDSEMRLPDFRLLFAEENILPEEFEFGAVTEEAKHSSKATEEDTGAENPRSSIQEQVNGMNSVATQTLTQEPPNVLPSEEVSMVTSKVLENVPETLLSFSDNVPMEQALESSQPEASQRFSNLTYTSEPFVEATSTRVLREEIDSLSLDFDPHEYLNEVQPFLESLIVSTVQDIPSLITEDFSDIMTSSILQDAVYSRKKYETHHPIYQTEHNEEESIAIGTESMNTRVSYNINGTANANCNINVSGSDNTSYNGNSSSASKVNCIIDVTGATKLNRKVSVPQIPELVEFPKSNHVNIKYNNARVVSSDISFEQCDSVLSLSQSIQTIHQHRVAGLEVTTSTETSSTSFTKTRSPMGFAGVQLNADPKESFSQPFNPGTFFHRGDVIEAKGEYHCNNSQFNVSDQICFLTSQSMYHEDQTCTLTDTPHYMRVQDEIRKSDSHQKTTYGTTTYWSTPKTLREPEFFENYSTETSLCSTENATFMTQSIRSQAHNNGLTSSLQETSLLQGIVEVEGYSFLKDNRLQYEEESEAYPLVHLESGTSTAGLHWRAVMCLAIALVPLML